MISSFRHRGLERFFTRSDRRGVPTQLAARLRGARRDTYAVAVSGNWRLTFRFEGKDAVDVDLEGYH